MAEVGAAIAAAIVAGAAPVTPIAAVIVAGVAAMAVGAGAASAFGAPVSVSSSVRAGDAAAGSPDGAMCHAATAGADGAGATNAQTETRIQWRGASAPRFFW